MNKGFEIIKCHAMNVVVKPNNNILVFLDKTVLRSKRTGKLYELNEYEMSIVSFHDGVDWQVKNRNEKLFLVEVDDKSKFDFVRVKYVLDEQSNKEKIIAAAIEKQKIEEREVSKISQGERKELLAQLKQFNQRNYAVSCENLVNEALERGDKELFMRLSKYRTARG